MSSNALGWVFPGQGEDTPPLQSEVDFGPIHYKDTIIIEFTPSDYTGDINLYCDYEDGQQGNIWTLTNTGSPLSYTFNQTTPNAQDPNDYHACHFLFVANTVSTSSGNTQAFQYLNNATKKAVTWSSGGDSFSPITSSSTSSTSTTTSSTSSSSSTSSMGQTSTSSQTTTASTSTSISTSISTSTSATTSSTASAAAASGGGGSSSPVIGSVSSPSGISGGAIAGIVIGVLALLAIIAGLGFYFGRRGRRKRAAEGPDPLPPRDETKLHPMYGSQLPQQQQQPGYPQQGYYGQQTGQVPAWAGKTHPQPVRMGELHGQQVSELDASPVHELGDGSRQ